MSISDLNLANSGFSNTVKMVPIMVIFVTMFNGFTKSEFCSWKPNLFNDRDCPWFSRNNSISDATSLKALRKEFLSHLILFDYNKYQLTSKSIRVSDNSTKKVDSLSKILSEAPILVKIRSLKKIYLFRICTYTYTGCNSEE